MNWRMTLAVVPLVTLVSVYAFAQELKSPSITPSILSPDSRFLVRQHKSIDADEGREYRLTILDRLTKKRLHLYTQHRDAIVRWSPDSKRIALSDFMGSDEGDCYLVRVPAIAFSSPDDRILKFLDIKQRLGGEIVHLYFDCERWISPRAIVIHVWGDGGVPGKEGPLNGFDARVRYSLSGKMKLLSLKTD